MEQYIDQGALYVAQGIVITIVGYFIYSVHERGFEVFGKYRTKEGAQAFIIIFLGVAGFVGPILLAWMEDVVQGYATVQIIGGILILSRLYVNYEVPYWNYDDERSLIVIAIGVILVVYPSI